MAFGQVDYSGPDRIKSAFQTVNNLIFRNKQAEQQVAQDQADRANASQAFSEFQTAAESGASNEDVFRAAAQTSSKLAASGGRHSQAAAKDVLDYLNAHIKMNPPKKPVPSVFKEVAPEGAAGPKLVKENGVQYEQSDYMDVTTGNRVPGSTHFSPHNPPGSLFGGLGMTPERNIGGLTERDPNGRLRIKRDPATGKPIPITRKEVETLQAQLNDDIVKLQGNLTALGTRKTLLEGTLATYQQQAAANEDGDNGLIQQQIANLQTQIDATDKEMQPVQFQLNDRRSLQSEAQEYDHSKVYPTAGAPPTGPKGFAHKLKKNQTAQ